MTSARQLQRPYEADARPKRSRTTQGRPIPVNVLQSPQELRPPQLVQIVQQGIRILEDNYVHLPRKCALHAVDPVGRLRLLEARLIGEPQDQPNEDEFHREMLDIFFSLRDRHTIYIPPDHWEGKVLYLPFMVEEINEGGQTKYIVSRILPGRERATFRKGVEIHYWNGIPVDRAVRNYADRHAGGNPDARQAMGLLNLTLRARRLDPPPDEDWVLVTYGPKLAPSTAKFRWAESENPWTARERDGGSSGCDPKLDLLLDTRRQQYRRRPRSRKTFTELPVKHRRIFRARRYVTPHGDCGYIRIWRFSDMDESQFVREFISLLEKLPQNGLIIDIRDNPGGKINLAEMLLQTLTSRRIRPEPFQFRVTRLNLEICLHAPESEKLALFYKSMRRGVKRIENGLATDAVYSDAFPKTDVRACNSIGQKYFGPVVLITNALSYSAADIFAAGFQDHRIGPILGTHRTTGAGGANRWTYEKLLGLNRCVLPYAELPGGAGFNVAMRRSLRVGRRTGEILEDVGVRSECEVHPMTRKDVLHDNVDLICKAAELLGKERAAKRKARTVRSGRSKS